MSFEKELNNCKWLLIASGLFLILGILLIICGHAYSLNTILTVL